MDGNDKKNPSAILKAGLNPKEIFKAIMPTGTEVLRGIGGGTALQIAENGNFGPIGTMAAAVVGDLLGHGTAATTKALLSPKQTAANIAAFLPLKKN